MYCHTNTFRFYVLRGCLAMILPVFLGIFCPETAAAQDLAHYYTLAQTNDQELQADLERYRAAEHPLKQAYAKFLPQASAEGTQTYTEQEVLESDNTVFGVDKTNYDVSEYTISMTQPLFQYEYYAELKKARASLKQAGTELASSREDLIMRVTNAYLEALAAGDNLRFVRAERAAVSAQHELTDARFQMGLVPITDFHDVQARLSLVEAEEAEAENFLDDALEALREISAEPVFETLSTFNEDIPLDMPAPVDVDIWMKKARNQGLQVRIAAEAMVVAQREIDVQMAGHLPVLEAFAEHNWTDSGSTLYGGGSEINTTEFGLQVSMSLFEGGAVISRTREARHRYLAARKDLEREARSAERSARTAFLGIKSAIRRVAALKQSVASQKLALQARQEGFKSGLFTSIAVLDAERDLYQAQKDFSRARYDYALNRLKLKQAVGTLGQDDLMEINSWLIK